MTNPDCEPIGYVDGCLKLTDIPSPSPAELASTGASTLEAILTVGSIFVVLGVVMLLVWHLLGVFLTRLNRRP